MTPSTSSANEKMAAEPKRAANMRRSEMNVQTIARKEATSKASLYKVNESDRAEEWMNERVKKGSAEPFAEVVMLTPAIANALLARNDENRPVSLANIERLKSDIEGGRWLMNGESIVVSKDGFLNDGQHRCIAVRETGRSVQTVVSFGVDREARFTTDVGVVRTVGHFVGMQGHKDSNAIATVATYVWAYREFGAIRDTPGKAGVVNRRYRRPTKSEVLHVANSFPDIAANLALTKNDAIGGRTINAFCRWAIARKAGDAAAAVFFERLQSGASLPPTSPILAARNRIINPKPGVRLTPNERAEIIIKAWNYDRTGDSRRLAVGSSVLPKIED